MVLFRTLHLSSDGFEPSELKVMILGDTLLQPFDVNMARFKAEDSNVVTGASMNSTAE